MSSQDGGDGAVQQCVLRVQDVRGLQAVLQSMKAGSNQVLLALRGCYYARSGGPVTAWGAFAADLHDLDRQ